MKNVPNNLHINTGKPANDQDNYVSTENKKDITLQEGRPNYPEQTEMDNDEVMLEQNQGQQNNQTGAISIRLLLWQSLLYTVLFTILFTYFFSP